MVPVMIDGRQVFGLVRTDGGGLRVRVSVDEFEQLSLLPGRQVRVELLGTAETFLLAGVEDVPPFAFLRLAPLTPRVA